MSNRKLFIAVIGICVALFALALATPALADLPPRPTPPPEPTSAPLPKTAGGWIELRAQNVKAQWSVVQWQDSAGKWIDVDSWRGAFDSVVDGVGKKTWWVDQTTFGPTLFRWVVYAPTNNQVLVQSAPFNLPKENKQTIFIQVTITP